MLYIHINKYYWLFFWLFLINFFSIFFDFFCFFLIFSDFFRFFQKKTSDIFNFFLHFFQHFSTFENFFYYTIFFQYYFYGSTGLTFKSCLLLFFILVLPVLPWKRKTLYRKSCNLFSFLVTLSTKTKNEKWDEKLTNQQILIPWALKTS